MPAVAIGIAALSTGLGIFSSSQSNKANKKAAQQANERALASAKATRETGIATTRMQLLQQREAVSRDSSLLLGQLAVAAAERGLTQSRTFETSISTVVQGMMSNLKQININAYLQEQQILAQTQFPEYAQYTPINVGMAGIQGGLSGLSAGLSISAGINSMRTTPSSMPSVPTYAVGPGMMA